MNFNKLFSVLGLFILFIPIYCMQRQKRNQKPLLMDYEPTDNEMHAHELKNSIESNKLQIENVERQIKEEMQGVHLGVGELLHKNNEFLKKIDKVEQKFERKNLALKGKVDLWEKKHSHLEALLQKSIHDTAYRIERLKIIRAFVYVGGMCLFFYLISWVANSITGS